MISLLPFFKSLSDETRIRMAMVLSRHELNVGELTKIMDMAQPSVSRHLKTMSDSGLVDNRKDGLKVFYSIPEKGLSRDLIDNLEKLGIDDEIIKRDLRKAKRIIKERTALTTRFFDNIAESWKAMRRETLGQFDLDKEVVNFLPDCETIIELGCGTGEMTEVLIQKAEEVIGIDSSQNMLNFAEKRFADREEEVSFRLGYMEHLPCADNEADYAVVSLSLHHLARPEAGISEAYRVLKPKGKLAVIDFERHKNEEMRKKYKDLWLGFSMDELTGWAENAGFSVCRNDRFATGTGLTLFILEFIKN